MRPDPWPHQIEGARALLAKPAMILADDVGLGKTRQVIDAMYTLYVQGSLDAAVIVAPATVCAVWRNPDAMIGEFAKHWPEGTPIVIHEYSTRKAALPRDLSRAAFHVVVTNYEFIRRKEGKGRKAVWPNLQPLVVWAGLQRSWLVLDESWSVQNPQAKQTHAAYKLRQVCARVTCVNGTPGDPDKMFAQFQILDENILRCPSQTVFRLRYCVMGGFEKREVTGYREMEDFKRRTAPFVIRREGVLDLPERLPPGTIEVSLPPKVWTQYVALRDEAVMELEGETDERVVARQAGVKHLRLAQILAGFTGGIESLEFGAKPDEIRHLHTLKQDATVEYALVHNLHAVIVWCRFVPEMDAMEQTFRQAGYEVFSLRGGQSPADRDAALRAFAPDTTHRRKRVMVGQPAAGGAGINLAAAAHNVYSTNTYNRKDRDQSEGRTDRPGQKSRPRYMDVIATGPLGQRTVDHSVLRVLRDRLDTAQWTKAMWIRALKGDA